MKKRSFFLLAATVMLAAGCARDDMLRTEGLTLGAGDALATNTALQLVDPWPTGVEDNELIVPSDRGADTSEASGGSNPKPASTTSTTNP